MPLLNRFEMSKIWFASMYPPDGRSLEIEKTGGYLEGSANQRRGFPAESVSVFLLLGVLLLSPWMLGGRPAQILQYLCLGVSASVLAWFFAQSRDRAGAINIPLVAIPLFVAILFGLLQLFTWNADTVSTISPTASRFWSLTENPIGDGSETEHRNAAQTLSLYPASTRHDVSLLTLALIVFLISAQFFAREQRQVKLWWLLLINGAALSLFGVLQQLTWNGKLFWFYEPAQINMAFASYVNHNHAAGYLLMCLGGGLGILMSNQVLRKNSTKQAAVRPGKGSNLLAGLLTLCIVIGILCSLSRGAFVAMAGAGLITLTISAFYAGRGLKFPYQLLSVALLAVAVLVGTGFSSTVSQRLDSITRQDFNQNTRIQHWLESSNTIPDFWLTGSGLGTYRYIHRLYMEQPSEEWFYHAENQYLEAMIEAGVIGLGLIFIVIGLMIAAIIFSLRKAPGISSRPFALAVLFALLSQCIHAFFDFGLYAPANMILLAAICGAGAGQASQFSDFSRWPHLFTFLRLRSSWLGAGFIFALSLQSLFPLAEAHKVAVLETAHARFVAQMTDPESTVEDKEVATLEFSDQLRNKPDDFRFQLALAEAWIELYREKAYLLLSETKESEQKRDEQGRVVRNPVIWSQTSIDNLNRLAGQWYRLGHLASLQNLRGQPVVKQTLRPAFRHLLLAREASPLFPRVHFTLAELSFLIRDPEGANPYLRPITELASRRCDLMYQAGLFYFEQSDYERAVACWKQSLQESDSYAVAIYQHSSGAPNGKRFPIELLPFSPATLIQLAEEISERSDQEQIRREILQRAKRILQKRDRHDPETHYQLAVVAELNRSPGEAIGHYKKALQLAPENLEWRYRYAQLLQKEGEFQEALKQAKACTQADTGNSLYRELYLAVYSQTN